MTTILLCLILYGLLMFAAGARFVTVRQQERNMRRGGYLDLSGIEL